MKRLYFKIKCNRRYLLAFIFSTIFINCFTYLYVSNERFIYTWDFIHYHDFFNIIGTKFLISPLHSVGTVLLSIFRMDYNFFPVSFLIPSYVLFGESRLTYILSLANVFLLPSVLLLTYLINKITTYNNGKINHYLFFLNYLTILLFWPLWVPLLRGYPAILGIIFICIILLIYLSNPLDQQSKLSLISIGVLLFLLSISRRWYNFWILSFFIFIILESISNLVLIKFQDFTEFKKKLKNIFTIGAVFSFLTLLFAASITLKIIKTEYSHIYSGFDEPYLVKLRNFILHFGSIYILMSIAGVLFTLKRLAKLRKVVWFFLFQLIFIYITFTEIQAFNLHHFLLLSVSIIVFITLFNKNILDILKKAYLRMFYTASYSMIVILLFFYVLTPKLNLLYYYSSYRILPKTYYPLVRSDVDEVYEIVDTLQNLLINDPRSYIYILSSSNLFDDMVLTNAIKLKKEKYPKLLSKLKNTSHVDKRDYFPFELLGANYILVSDPIQYHLYDTSEQSIIGIPARDFLENKGIGKFYTKLDYEFELDRNVKIYIYKKSKVLNFKDLRKFFQKFIKRYPDWSDKFSYLPLYIFVKDQILGDNGGKISFPAYNIISITPGINSPSILALDLNKGLVNLDILVTVNKIENICNENYSNSIELTIMSDKNTLYKSYVDSDENKIINLYVGDSNELNFMVTSTEYAYCFELIMEVKNQVWDNNFN